MVAPDLCRALVSSKAAFNDVLDTSVTRRIGLFFYLKCLKKITGL